MLSDPFGELFGGTQILLVTRSLGARWAQTSRPPARIHRPTGPRNSDPRPLTTRPRTGLAFGPSGLLDFVLRTLRALRPCDPRNSAMME